MKTVILSPHTDDAIFSLGDYIQRLEDVTVLSVFSGIPKDISGQNKHIVLRKEHERACEVLGVKYINGDFLDDVYEPRPTMEALLDWLLTNLKPFDHVIAPIGIHHPDHILLRNTLYRMGIAVDEWYGELPYRALYPDTEADLVEKFFKFRNRKVILEAVSGLKLKAIQCYASQIQSDHILSELMVPEKLYD